MGRLLTSPESESAGAGWPEAVGFLGAAAQKGKRHAEIKPEALKPEQGAGVCRANVALGTPRLSPNAYLWSPEEIASALAFTVGSMASPICKYRNLCSTSLSVKGSLILSRAPGAGI